MTLLKNRFFIAFAGIYLISLTMLTLIGGQSVIEPLFILGIFGLALPGIAYLICRKAVPIPIRVEISRRETQTLAAYVLFMVVYLTWGSDWIDGIIYNLVVETPKVDLVVTLVKKVFFFVVIPFSLFAKLFGYSLKDFGFTGDWSAILSRRHVAVLFAVSTTLVAVQLLLGQGAKALGSGEFAVSTMVIGGAIYFVWLLVEVGLVEEFFFRGLVQSRMTAIFNSEVAGIFAMALIFGLAHAPGLYLRGAGEITALGTEPSLLAAASYSIVILSVAGLVFGVVWALTRNIYILMVMHAVGDLLPNLPEFLRIAT